MATQYQLIAVITALLLAACTAQSGNVKPPAAQSAGILRSPACQPQTGSRMAAENTDHSIVASCYTSADISRTGVPNAAQALQIMDPSVRVGH